jgi:hypothetical protein
VLKASFFRLVLTKGWETGRKSGASKKDYTEVSKGKQCLVPFECLQSMAMVAEFF